MDFEAGHQRRQAGQREGLLPLARGYIGSLGFRYYFIRLGGVDELDPLGTDAIGFLGADVVVLHISHQS